MSRVSKEDLSGVIVILWHHWLLSSVGGLCVLHKELGHSECCQLVARFIGQLGQKLMPREKNSATVLKMLHHNLANFSCKGLWEKNRIGYAQRSPQDRVRKQHFWYNSLSYRFWIILVAYILFVPFGVTRPKFRRVVKQRIYYKAAEHFETNSRRTDLNFRP